MFISHISKDYSPFFRKNNPFLSSPKYLLYPNIILDISISRCYTIKHHNKTIFSKTTFSKIGFDCELTECVIMAISL